MTSLAARLRRLLTPPVNVDLLLCEYQRFLQLRVAHRDEDGTLLAPSAAIERVCRTHVLDTRGYAAMNRMLPFFVHYADEEEGGEDHRRRMANTLVLYRARWGEPPTEVWNDDEARALMAAALAVPLRPSPPAGTAVSTLPTPPSSTAPAPPPPAAARDAMFDLVVLSEPPTTEEIVLRVCESDMVHSIMVQYETLRNAPVGVTMLWFRGKVLPFWETLAQCEIHAWMGRVCVYARRFVLRRVGDEMG
ncbi:hypothetical protein AMAG_00096 [Allomyces macrogynus ATCC 38327]|uniref:Uncharacterized protein n=1 Tax=Allomyces macrogynus (strain ATCC 38327) TaxID=578462 RepID=A0A0L0RVD6_ALLM3|nr:hypothetical protein AMAG_00096 [Allomyces macrogynus ATCC 38327]|eukprot:KNE54094.1 hypothetical protein AMAG_00096 [Allomyces macrogynus ATCC 38327]